jgi:hypothetical protein
MSTQINLSKQIAIKDEGVVKTSNVNSIDFTGAGVTATNVGNDVTVNIPGGGGGGTEIGAQIGGGIVVAVFNDAGVNKALVASLTNLSTALPWTITAFQTTLIGATAQSFYDGLTNTNAIIAQTLLPANTNNAAGRARLFAGGGFSDWYLPSYWELVLCYNSASIVNKILGATNGFNPSIGFYWSSTESSATRATMLNFGNGTHITTDKNFTPAVRAVRIHTI